MTDSPCSGDLTLRQRAERMASGIEVSKRERQELGSELLARLLTDEQRKELRLMLVGEEDDLVHIKRTRRGPAIKRQETRIAAIDAKMAVNRARRWKLDGNGHGQHVEEGQ